MDNLQQEPTAQDLKFSERRKWTLKEWWEHVGAWKTDRDTLEFGSTIAFGVMMQQFAACLKWTLTQQPAFPVRDLSKPAEQQGIFQKFDVRRTDGSSEPGGKHYGCKYFVLDLDHDPYSPAAMQAYAEKCKETHPVLSAEIKAQFGEPCTTCGGSVSGHSPDGEYRGECPVCSEVGKLRSQLKEAINRINDMLVSDDGQAHKEARKFVESNQKDLASKGVSDV